MTGITAKDIKMLLDAAVDSYLLYSRVSVPWIREVEGQPEEVYLRQQTARSILMAQVSVGTSIKSLDSSQVLDLNTMIEQYMMYLEEKSSKVATAKILADMMQSDD